MTFVQRNDLSERISQHMDLFFEGVGFQLVKTGYEEVFPNDYRQKIRYLYDDPSVTFARFMPDRFAFFDDKNIFYIEYKICNTPIIYESRVRFLNKLNNSTNLTKKNIGALETEAFSNYQKLNSLGVRVLIVIYSEFHNRPVVANWINKINPVYQDKVIFGQGNASRTPYTNINLDDFVDIGQLLSEDFGISKEKININYKRELGEFGKEIIR